MSFYFCFGYVSFRLFIFLISISFMICNVNWKWVFFEPLLHYPKNKDEIVNVCINAKRHHIHANKQIMPYDGNGVGQDDMIKLLSIKTSKFSDMSQLDLVI